jgi:prepilin-type processing-associated H-X9-DG protein
VADGAGLICALTGMSTRSMVRSGAVGSRTVRNSIGPVPALPRRLPPRPGMGPNSPVPDCADTCCQWPDGVFAARSAHPGGVNLLTADGSVRFVDDSIDLSVWRAIGSIDGGETDHW